ncbi:MAG: 3-oxoacyl-(Acyl-carrier-protein) reductase [Candidatus Jorgensenbacteria bacterium GW2011_GWA1_48_11]|uniref:3-oxoacyl-(Acyl-carrier-protein) reductase n=1 Tax=Candidatus Jorgensenbacteria bacterium GW2011_GWA1_48_11 TaxID=1618660 RepID=A0A0G1WMB5_9BACT|nr:MAG: 3-oxoacyl-(Acyl-carrier-protein) reductase [Candidatus Jorgensenbacteria bacterium GW2011_GWA1_48_11]KKW11971.1 MAG: 3-oxoacyl-(Acyl-carrier-protein) reductase [Candidatus Jorgensenbacteria bacterium GW2011_GWB1_49_9]
MNKQSNKSRVVVISGATGYVGSAITEKLAADGLKIAALYRENGSNETAVGLIAGLAGAGHRSYSCDLEDPARVEETIRTIEKEQGAIRVCIHAAGTAPKPKQLHLSSSEELKEQFGLNVFGSFNFLAACAKRIKEQKEGVIIGITTAAVITQVNTRARGAYSPAKFALQGILAAFREELAPLGVRVYSVAPGVLPGGMNSATPQAFLDMFREKSPTKTLAQAADVAAMISFLCSPESRSLTNLTFLIAPESETN